MAEKVDFNLKPHRQVLSYEIAGYEQQVDHCELVAVADVSNFHYFFTFKEFDRIL